VNAQEAFQLDIVNKVVEPEQLLEETIIYVKQVLENAPLAIGYAKTAINRGLDMDLANGLLLEREMFALSFSTEDKREEINAFIEKRKPVFQNK
jgi:enoyl-CoA hydratase